jgi:antitoxin HigA-1
LWIIIEPVKTHSPIHPGEILREDFLVPLGLSEYRLAKEIKVPARRINEIVKGRRAVSADTALRLARYLGWPAEVWLNLQSHYDQQVAEQSLRPILDGIKAFPRSAVVAETAPKVRPRSRKKSRQ